jgi:hypothetical protein
MAHSYWRKMTTHQTSLGGLNMTNLLTQDVVPSDPSYRLIPLTQGQFAIVDAADFEWLNQWKWFAQKTSNGRGYYAKRWDSGKHRKYLRMHNVILGIKRGGDHRNGNTLDNRRSNLRKATKQQNSRNHALRKDCSSGFTGVGKIVRKSGMVRWRAYIRVSKKMRLLGCFPSIEEARAARSIAAKKYYGEYSR